MALNVKRALPLEMEREIRRRFEVRGADRELSKTEKQKIATIADSARALASGAALSLLRAFLDHVMPTGGRFRPLRSIYFEWQTFVAETWPQVSYLFPITAEDEEVLTGFFADWKAIRAQGYAYLAPVYYRRDRLGGAPVAKAYRHGPEFLRVLGVLRRAQGEQEEYPLFTLRGFLAAQIEAISGYVSELIIGNVVSEKAWGRYREWYMFRYYGPELAVKARRRPSDNNPCSNKAIRLDHERERAARGQRPADHVMDGERAVAWWNRPALYWVTEDAGVPLDGPGEPSDARIELPPGMTL